VSERRIEVLRRWTEEFNARDLEAQIAHCDPEIEYQSTFAAIGGAVYHGHDGMRRWHKDLDDAWGERIRLEPEAFFDLGEHTLAFFALHGRGQHSGVEVAMPIANVLRWRDDRVVYFRAYVDRDEALRDLCVSEDELEPIAP
jgi:ketosteroid isomerase-like protein